MKANIKKKCKFEKDGYCTALICYSKEKCGARDQYGNPKYIGYERLFEEGGAN